MAIILSTIQERIERSVFEAIAFVLTESGYYPDEAALVNNPNGPQLLKDAIDQIKITKGFCIESFGVGSSQAKGLKQVPRIVVVSRRSMPGEINTTGEPNYIPNDEQNPSQYKKLSGNANASNLHFDISLVSNTAAQDRVMNSIIMAALGLLRYLEFYDTLTGERFLIRQYNYYDLPDVQEGITEKVYSYEIPDVFIEEQQEEELEYPIVPIKQIDLHTFIGDSETPGGIVHVEKDNNKIL